MAAIGGSGLDVQGIVSQLMNIERAPLRAIDRKIAEQEDKISALGRLTSSLADLKSSADKLQNTSNLEIFKAESSDTDVLTASASSLEVEENHTIVVEELAARHRIASETVYDAPLDSVGAGSYTFSAGDKNFEVTLEEGESSLTDLSNAINRAADNSGINASIIHVDDGYRLVLSARNSGTENTITAAGEWEQLSEAKDATIEVNGLTIHPSSNTVSDVIPGVTLTLKSTGTVNLSTGADKEKIVEAFEDFAKNYNNVQNTLKQVNSGDLRGESLSVSVDTAVRNNFFKSFENSEGITKTAFDFGFTFDKEGKLSVDREKINDSVDNDLYGMLSFLSHKDSFAKTMSNSIDALTKSGGIFDSRKKSFNSSVSRFESRAERLENRLERVNERLLQTYSQLDRLVTQSSSTSNAIVQSLSALNSRNN